MSKLEMTERMGSVHIKDKVGRHDYRDLTKGEKKSVT